MLLLSTRSRPTPSQPCGCVWILSWVSTPLRMGLWESVWFPGMCVCYCKTDTDTLYGFPCFFLYLLLLILLNKPSVEQKMNTLVQNICTYPMHWSIFKPKPSFSSWVGIPVLLLRLLGPLYASIIFPSAAHNSAQHSLITGLYQDSYIRLASMQIHTVPSCISCRLDMLWISLLVLRNANKASSLFLFSFPLTSHCLRISNMTNKWMTNKTAPSLCLTLLSVPFLCAKMHLSRLLNMFPKQQ